MFNRTFWFVILLSTLAVTAALFYIRQNSGELPGGGIALVKILWLMCVIFFWFFAPFFVLNAKNADQGNTLIKIHLANVYSRAVVELFMLYWLNNWKATYGISHDIFSFAVLAIGLLYCYKSLSLQQVVFFGALIGTFIAEAYFAWYMLTNVGAHVWFVPDASEFQPVFIATWLALVGLAAYCFFFVKEHVIARNCTVNS